jgi:translation initiation factor IF-2
MAEKSPNGNAKTALQKPPVVVVLGHVDHGKTTLLDTIRKTHVQEGEAGGITQHIGAYQVLLKKDDPDSAITFIDTPGHEAFSKMRSRGAQVADVAILVVAANDGVKPQTKEAISHIKKASLPFVVAINKTDIPGVNLDVVKSQLAENDVIVEDYGGTVVAVPISAKQNKGISNLLEMLMLLYELEEKQANRQGLNAIVLESYMDSKRGTIANVLVRSGSIKAGDIVYCQGEKAKIRIMLNENSKIIEKADVSQPAQILGFKTVLPVGSIVTKTPQEEIIDTKITNIPSVKKEEEGEQQQKLRIVLKADVAGTLEAIKANLTEEIELIGDGVGDITESDVLLAQSTNARLIGFSVRVPTTVKKLADMEKVKIETFNIIYHLLEDLQKRVLKMMEPEINEEVLGEAEIIAEFNIKGSHIAGCKVTTGSIIRSEKVKIMREDKLVGQPRIAAMQIERKDEKEAKKGQEVALVFRPDARFQVGDKVISYKIVEN